MKKEAPQSLTTLAREVLSGQWFANKRKERLLRSEARSTAKQAYQSLYSALSDVYQQAGLILDSRHGVEVIKIPLLRDSIIEDPHNWDVVRYSHRDSLIDVVKSREKNDGLILSQLHLRHNGDFSIRSTDSQPDAHPHTLTFSLGDITHDSDMVPIQQAVTSLTQDTISRLATLDPARIHVTESRASGLQTTPYGLRARGIYEAPRP